MNRTALKMASPVLMAILASVAVADERAANPEDARPAFDELVVKFEPSFLSSFGQIEQVQITRDGRCTYKVEGREAQSERRCPKRHGAHSQTSRRTASSGSISC